MRQWVFRGCASQHLVFLGCHERATTVARLLAQMYRAMDLLTAAISSSSTCGLVGQYVEHAAINRRVIRRASRRSLFIDEATRSRRGDDTPGLGP